MKNKLLAIFVLVMALGFSSTVYAEGEEPLLISEDPAATDVMTIDPEVYYLFVATGCPHCANVEKYMEENDIQNEFDVQIFDIAVETDKQDDLLQLCQERAQSEQEQSQCGGVPEMIHGEDLYIGEDEIINYFKAKGYNAEPVDWGRWVVVGLLGGAVLTVTGLIAYPLIFKK